MRAPKVENKYNLTISKIKEFIIGDRSKVCKPLFVRNENVGSWMMKGASGKGFYGPFNSFFIGIYDDGKFEIDFTSYEDMCGYVFEHFFDPAEMENEDDLEIQELFLEKINMLIDEGILLMPEEKEEAPVKQGSLPYKRAKELFWMVKKAGEGYLIIDSNDKQIGYGLDEKEMRSICDNHNELVFKDPKEVEKTKLGRKYLTDIGWEPWDAFENDSREKDWEEERRIYGFDQRDTWNLNYTMYELLYERLKMYDEVNIVDTSFYKFEYKGKTLTQQECIDRILECLEPILDGTYDSWDEEYAELSHEAMELYTLCHMALWW